MIRTTSLTVALAITALAPSPLPRAAAQDRPAMTTEAAAPLAPVGEPETARVISLVQSIPLAVDLAAYDLAERAFAAEVVIDYTSLWGGEPATMTPATLMDAWRGIVPGFDATWHELSAVTVAVAADRATATALVDGRHWIGTRVWRPIGRYHWSLAKADGRWQVTHMTFQLTQELGDRGLAAEAMERAKRIRR